MLFNCHPPRIADNTPPLLSHRRPGPNGNSVMLRTLKTCVRLKSATARVQMVQVGNPDDGLVVAVRRASAGPIALDSV